MAEASAFLAAPTPALALGLGVGLLASTLFFAGLAWSLQRMLHARRPAVLLLASFILRAGILLGLGAVLLQLGQPLWALVGYTMGFFIVRALALRWGRRAAPTPRDQQETS